jgi:hypothetical protein
MCPTCSAICDEAGTGPHDAWHQSIDQKTLPLLSDFITDVLDTVDAQNHEHSVSPKDLIRLPSLTPADLEV